MISCAWGCVACGELTDTAWDQVLERPDIAKGICSAATKGGFDQVVNSIVGQDRRSRFDVVMAGDDVPRKKPDPIIYQMASDRVQVPPERCVVIEDSLVGLRAAKGAGMKCIITYTESTKDEDFYGEGADAVVADLSKVADMTCLMCLICVRLSRCAGCCNHVLAHSLTVDASCGNGPAPARESASSSASSVREETH